MRIIKQKRGYFTTMATAKREAIRGAGLNQRS
ncbi:hypothetical protein X566_19150 [Afipia sp. P52-10]|nr:hypothetical protein X566_19150 [Afipia sp. P52-10]